MSTENTRRMKFESMRKPEYHQNASHGKEFHGRSSENTQYNSYIKAIASAVIAPIF